MFEISVQPSTYLFGQGIAYAAGTTFPDAANKRPHKLQHVGQYCGLAIHPSSEVRGVNVRRPGDSRYTPLVEGSPIAFCGEGEIYLEPLRGYQHDGRLTLCFAENGHELNALPMHLATKSVLTFQNLDPDTNTGDRFRLVRVAPSMSVAVKPTLQASLFIDAGSSGSGSANVRSYRLTAAGELGDYLTTAFAWPAASAEVSLEIPQCDVAAIELYSTAGYGPLSGLVVVT